MTTVRPCGALFQLPVCILAATLVSFGYGQTPNSSLGSAGSSSSSNSATTISRKLQGQVVNALDGAAVPRVLVQINSRSVLTDTQGRFEFPDFTDTQAYVTLTKPGFAQSNSSLGGATRQKVANLDATINLKLYPNATITGTVTGRDGLPLTHVPVLIKHGVFDQSGWRWVPTRANLTDLHGEYRVREPAGRYQVAIGFVARSNDTGEAILPVQFPAITSSTTLDYFEVQSGQEKRIDLSPKTGPAYSVQVKLSVPAGPDATRGVQFYAVTSGGDAFQVPSQGGNQVSLPAGTYTLHARLENRDTALEGSTRLTVTGRQTDAAAISMEPAAVIPVELTLEPTTTAAATSSNGVTQNQALQQPDLRQFNLRLHSLDQSGLPFSQDVMLRTNDNHSYEFRVMPGRYRLMAAFGGMWWIASATSGVTNLMSSDIVIGSGGSGTPIRIVASNVQGSVSATIRFPTNTDTVYLYLIPKNASLAQINPITVTHSGNTVASISTRLPIGSYLAVAFDHQIEADLRDPEVLSKISSAAKSVDISGSATVNVDLDIAEESKP